MLVVDAMNVIGSRPDGWWRDRPGAVRRLVNQLARLASSEDVVAVVDGRPVPDLAAGDHDGVEVIYARRSGPNAADDRIVELVGGIPDLDDVRVVTSDRDLAARVRELGADVVGASWLLDRLG